MSKILHSFAVRHAAPDGGRVAQHGDEVTAAAAAADRALRPRLNARPSNCFPVHRRDGALSIEGMLCVLRCFPTDAAASVCILGSTFMSPRKSSAGKREAQLPTSALRKELGAHSISEASSVAAGPEGPAISTGTTPRAIKGRRNDGGGIADIIHDTLSEGTTTGSLHGAIVGRGATEKWMKDTGPSVKTRRVKTNLITTAFPAR